MRVLVTGATGFVGSNLVPALLERGHEVRVLVRDPTRYDGPEAVEVATGDLLEPDSFDGALEGIEAAYYLVHSMQAGKDFEAKDRQAARNFAVAASTEGVDRVIYLGGLGEENTELSPHLKSRREVEHILRDGDCDLTTLRAAIIIGDGSASFEMIRQMDRRLPVMLTPQWVETPSHPIAIDDVVAYLAGVLDLPETAGETYDIGGPEVLSYAQILRRTGKAMGTGEPYIVPVPVLSPRLSSYWIGLVTDVPTSVARPLIEGLKNPVVADDGPIRELLPIELTSFETAVERAIGERDRRLAVQKLPTEATGA
jgi:uncharacterized protein YbjT (DUF2867 family)